jgi:phospholipase C
MRRSVISSLSVVAVLVAAGTVALTTSSAASRAAHAGCAAARHAKRTHCPALTITAAPNPATAGTGVVISGRLLRGRAGRAVALWREEPGWKRFRKLAVTRTGASGQYKFVRNPGAVDAGQRWYVAADGVASRTVAENVYALVTFSASNTTPPPGRSATFTGHVTPSHRGEQIELQENTGSGWHEIGHAGVSGKSDYAITHTFATAGTVDVRAFLPSDKRNLSSASSWLPVDVGGPGGIHKIQHVVIIMQENRSFDQYFGTYPGADGIPGLAGNAGTIPCDSDPKNGGCIEPYHDTQDKNYGGPHGATNATADIDGGKMDGFVGQAEKGTNCATINPNCSPCTGNGQSQCIDVMGYHDGADIPNYWTYAHDFVLQDHMFESNASWSQPEHLYLVSGWSAKCTNPTDAFSCTNALESPNEVTTLGARNTTPLFAWTDITYLLHKYGVSWGYYVFQGSEPDCDDPSAEVCPSTKQGAKSPTIWNPLPHFTDVHDDNQLGNIQAITNFYTAAQNGTLPQVSWVIPNGTVSEHPPALVSTGETYVTGLINAIMRGPDWDSTAIFLNWDDWGGFYDQVDPPYVDENGYGLRVPGLVISPYAKQGYIDHQILSQDAYNKFIEDDFLDGQALNPATDGRPDPRPDVREDEPILGNLVDDFDFKRAPRPPVILPVCPATDLTPTPTCTPFGTAAAAARSYRSSRK